MRLCSAARRASRSGISVTIHTKANPFSMYASCRHFLQGCRARVMVGDTPTRS